MVATGLFFSKVRGSGCKIILFSTHAKQQGTIKLHIQPAGLRFLSRNPFPGRGVQTLFPVEYKQTLLTYIPHSAPCEQPKNNFYRVAEGNKSR